MTITSSDPLVEAIDVEDVTAYLGLSGWRRRADFPRPELCVFDGPDDDAGEPIHAVFPSSSRFADFRDKLAHLLDALSVLEERPAAEIALDMLSPSVDRVRARVISDMSATGSIPLPFASLLLHGLRDLVASSACAEEEPRPFFTKATRIGSEHARSWRFGQTQRGSFTATIECAVLPATGPSPPPGARSTPFARRVTERIMRGLGTLERAVLDGRPDPLFEGYQHGFNANMCEALLSLKSPGAELGLELSVQWSKRLAAPLEIPRRVLIERRGFELLDVTAKALRIPKESAERAFVGEIVKLQRESAEERTAVLRFVEDGRRIQAKIHLGAEEYDLACEAHRREAPVTLHGRLERVGNKQWSIFGVHDFGVAVAGETTKTMAVSGRR